jgi:2-iminobutanoate/2-iminopropanoate deaminase
MKEFAAMNAVYAECFGDHAPARSTVEVAKLPLGAKVEIECIAAR